MVSIETKVTLPFVLIATLLWYGSLGGVDRWVSWIILIGIGVLLPTIITGYLRGSTE